MPFRSRCSLTLAEVVVVTSAQCLSWNLYNCDWASPGVKRIILGMAAELRQAEMAGTRAATGGVVVCCLTASRW